MPYRGNISVSKIFIESLVIKNKCPLCLQTDSSRICCSLFGGYGHSSPPAYKDLDYGKGSYSCACGFLCPIGLDTKAPK